MMRSKPVSKAGHLFPWAYRASATTAGLSSLTDRPRKRRCYRESVPLPDVSRREKACSHATHRRSLAALALRPSRLLGRDCPLALAGTRRSANCTIFSRWSRRESEALHQKESTWPSRGSESPLARSFQVARTAVSPTPLRMDMYLRLTA